MAKSKLSSEEETRDLTITMEPVSGGITMFYAFIDGSKKIQDDGTEKRTWKGKIPEAQVRLKVRVTGIGKAEYKLGLDLPGTLEDQSLSFKLKGGYHETEILL